MDWRTTRSCRISFSTTLKSSSYLAWSKSFLPGDWKLEFGTHWWQVEIWTGPSKCTTPMMQYYQQTSTRFNKYPDSLPEHTKVCQATIPISSSVSSSPLQLVPLPPWSPSLPPPVPLGALIHHDPCGPVHHGLRCLGHHGPCGRSHDLPSRQNLRSATPPWGKVGDAVWKLRDIFRLGNDSRWCFKWWIMMNHGERWIHPIIH